MNRKQSQIEPLDILSGLIAFDAQDRAIWPIEQLQYALRQQLESRIFVASERSTSPELACLRSIAASASPPVETLRDLLQHPCPPIELLWEVKNMAKRNSTDHHGPIPPEVWHLVYYGVISAAFVRCNQRITRLTDDQLRASLNWALRQPWLDTMNRVLFLETLRYLGSSLHLWRQ